MKALASRGLNDTPLYTSTPTFHEQNKTQCTQPLEWNPNVLNDVNKVIDLIIINDRIKALYFVMNFSKRNKT